VSDTGLTFLGIDHGDPAWPWALGQRMLDAAVSCGWECTNRFVADGQWVEPPPPDRDCRCQLAVVVTPGVDEPTRRDGERGPVCMPVFTADLLVVVDLCVLVPASNRRLTAAQVDAHALENQTALWKIMQGLMKGRSSGTIAGFGATLNLGGWDPMGQSGGSARWQTRWSYRQ
jgi:hypothetical protein